jgi:hypothetical protein
MTFRLAVTILLAVLAVLAAGAGPSSAGPATPPSPAAAPQSKPLPSGAKRRVALQRYRAFVDMPTFMAHVLTPAATIVWRTNGFVNDADGDHDLSPKTDADWEAVVSGAATLAEATNALRIPARSVDAAWNGYVDQLADAAERAYVAAEKHDLATLADVSDHLDAICSACHLHYGLE